MSNARRRYIDLSALPAKGMLLMNLSLFIMLLAFFIVMNALSTYEEVYYRPVVKSLEDTFATGVFREGNAPSETPARARSIGEGSVIERIDALFNAQIVGFDMTHSPRAGILYVTVPLEEFDRAVTAANQVDLTRVKSVTGLQTYFLPTLVSILKADEEGRPYRMDIILHTKDTPPLLVNSDPRALSAVMKQAGAYAARLEKAGMAQRLLSIGVQKGDPQSVELYFRPALAARGAE